MSDDFHQHYYNLNNPAISLDAKCIANHSEVPMFEYEQEIVEDLRSTNKQFERLYREHSKLKKQVHDADLGVLPLDDYTLENMKKKKLMAKDRMAMMIRQYKQEHAAT
jgi:uncharacterized protein YdcH (DUF465 family)